MSTVRSLLVLLVVCVALAPAAAQQASVSDLGPGCVLTGAAVTPPIVTASSPELGESLDFVLESEMPFALVIALVSGPVDAPYPQILGCPVYVDVQAFSAGYVAVTGADGSASFSLALPFDLALAGIEAHVQFALWSPAGDSLSNGLKLVIGLPDADCVAPTSNDSNFNGTAIPAGRTIWFNAVIKPDDTPTAGGVVVFENAEISFTSGGVLHVVPVPRNRIVYAPGVTSASTTWDPVAQEWNTLVPAGYSGNVFLGGAAYTVPAAGLPGGINPVDWVGDVTSSISGFGFHWKWGAAVYTDFAADPAAIGVKPIDGSANNPYANSHKAGTPENWLDFVVGGARGGGGSNFTGSYSGTESGVCP